METGILKVEYSCENKACLGQMYRALRQRSALVSGGWENRSTLPPVSAGSSGELPYSGLPVYSVLSDPADVTELRLSAKPRHSPCISSPHCSRGRHFGRARV